MFMNSLVQSHLCVLRRFERGVLSSNTSRLSSPPRQFPLILAQLLLMTLSAWVFLKNTWALGLSLVAPLCLCFPKNFSNGS